LGTDNGSVVYGIDLGFSSDEVVHELIESIVEVVGGCEETGCVPGRDCACSSDNINALDYVAVEVFRVIEDGICTSLVASPVGDVAVGLF